MRYDLIICVISLSLTLNILRVGIAEIPNVRHVKMEVAFPKADDR